MEEKLDAILDKLEELSERMDMMEEWTWEIQRIGQLVDILYEFKKMDFPQLDRENLIFIHTNAIRTASFVDSLVDPFGGLTQTNEMTKAYLTPDYLSDLIRKDKNIVVRSDIFTWSSEFERIIGNAIENKEACFVILTNDIESVPQSLRGKMRVMQ